MMTRCTALFAFALLASVAQAMVVMETIDYEHDGVELQGVLYYDNALDGPLPGVLVIHEWWGHNDYARTRARMLAEEGYAAFALDMYGTGVLVDDPAEAQALATPFYEDRSRMRARARAGFDVMVEHEAVDARSVAAIGYCMGGTVALELARSGAPLDAVVAYHAGLSTTNADDARNITGSVLVCTGAVDVWVTEEERTAFNQEMERAGVDYQHIEYGGAVHSFTSPEADERGMDNVAYDEKADRRSWRATLALFEETLRGG